MKIVSYVITLKTTKKIVFNYFPGFILRNALDGAKAGMYCHKQREQNMKPGGCAVCAYVSGCNYHKLNLPTHDRKSPEQQPYLIDAFNLKHNERFSENGVFHFRFIAALREPAERPRHRRQNQCRLRAI